MTLQISSTQIAAFDAAAREHSHRQLVAWVRQYADPAKQKDDKELLELIARQEPRAAAFGIESEREFAKWCFIAVMTAERFYLIPERKAYLSHFARISTLPQASL